MISPGRAVALVLFVAAGLCPLVLDEFKTGLIGLGLTYGLFAVGLDVAWGRAGLISIGQAVFFGFGCYGVAVAEATNRSGFWAAQSVWCLPSCSARSLPWSGCAAAPTLRPWRF